MSTGVLIAASKHANAIPFLEWAHVLDGKLLLCRGALRKAASYGHVELLEWFQKKGVPWSSLALVSAATTGQLHVLRYSKEKKLPLPPPGSMSRSALSGNLDVLRWVKENNFHLENCFSWASLSGHVHVLEWLLTEGGVRPDLAEQRKCYRNAAGNSHMEVFRWLHDNGFLPDQNVQPELFLLAASRGSLEILRWMKEKGCDGIKAVCLEAARNGQLEAAKWGWQEGGPWGEEEKGALMRAAVQGGSMETMKWMHERVGTLSPSLYDDALTVGVNVCEIFNFLETHGCPCVLDENIWEVALSLENLEFLDWLSSRGPLLPCFWVIAVKSNSPRSLRWLKTKDCPREEEGEDLFLLTRSVGVLEWLKKEGGFLPRGGPEPIKGHQDKWTYAREKERESVWWLLREGYNLKMLVVYWVWTKEWDLVKKAIEEGLPWDEEIWRRLVEEEEMKDWVQENWRKKEGDKQQGGREESV
jgi:hypothetical protein